MSEFIDKTKAKFKEIKEKCKEKKDEIVGFLEEHPQLVAGAIGGIGMIVANIINGVTDTTDTNNEKVNKCAVEDDETGLDFITTHPLTNSEILELGERMNNGQTKGEALYEMGVLKKEKKRR